jgi:hypothetical protein
MAFIVKYSGTLTASTAAVASTNTPTFTGKIMDITIGPKGAGVSSSAVVTFGRGTSDDLIINPADQFSSTATVYRFAPRQSVNIASSGGTVPVTSGSVPLQLAPVTLVDERVSVSVSAASSSVGVGVPFSIRVDGSLPSTTP